MPRIWVGPGQNLRTPPYHSHFYRIIITYKDIAIMEANIKSQVFSSHLCLSFRHIPGEPTYSRVIISPRQPLICLCVTMYTVASNWGYTGTYTVLIYMYLCTFGLPVTTNLANRIQSRPIKTTSTRPKTIWGRGLMPPDYDRLALPAINWKGGYNCF